MTVENMISKTLNNAGIYIAKDGNILFHKAAEGDTKGRFVIATITGRATSLSTCIKDKESS